jgi:hypothetical protein
LSSDFSEAVWRSDYAGKQEKILTLADWPQGQKEASVYYAYDFRVDPSEKYIALERSYYPQPDYAIVIKNLDTKKDAFVLPLSEMQKIDHSAYGSFELGRWFTLGGDTYLWGDIIDGAYASAYYRINRDTWQVDVWPTPNDFNSGVERASSPYGYLAYVNIPTFTGFAEITQDILDDAVKKGIKKGLKVANLKTGKVETIESIDPHYSFDMKWLDDWKTLQYHMPDGTVKTYTITP